MSSTDADNVNGSPGCAESSKQHRRRSNRAPNTSIL
jgi:hypothetical protein